MNFLAQRWKQGSGEATYISDAARGRGRTLPVIFSEVWLFQSSQWVLGVILQVAAASLLPGLKDI